MNSLPRRLPAGDRRLIDEAVLPAYLFVSSVNALCAVSAFEADEQAKRAHPAGIIISLRNALAAAPGSWPHEASMVRYLSNAGYPLPTAFESAEKVARIMMHPQHPEVEESTGRWLTLKRHVGRIRPGLPLASKVKLHVDGERSSGPGVARRVQTQRYRTVHPPYDPILIVQGLLVQDFSVDQHAADHYIQQWIRAVFCGRFDERKKRLLNEVCRRVNYLFYRNPRPTRQLVHGSRASTLTATRLLEELENIVIEVVGAPEQIPGGAKRQAFGLYLLLRFNRSVRIQYAVRDDGAPGTDDAAAAEPARPGPPELLVSADRPLEYGYLQNRLFGGLSGVRGFNFVLRGGIMPRIAGGHTFSISGPPGSGKTSLAIHLMADLAARGRFGAIVTMEEGSETVLDKLVSFGLVDFELFDVVALGPDLHERLVDAHGSGRGVLLVHATERGAQADVETVLAQISLHLRDLHRFKWRGIAIDSIDALAFSADDGNFPGEIDRSQVKRLLKTLDEQRFWGLLVGEEGERFSVLEYLADTVIVMGREGDPETRFLSIKKSRFQRSHGGKHAISIREGGGVRIYPSLAAVQSACRRRIKATPSVERSIPFGPEWEIAGLYGLPEKSSALVVGPTGVGKTSLLLKIATEASVRVPGGQEVGPPQAVLIVTFRTSELALGQLVRSHRMWQARWDRVLEPQVRWYSPGSQLGGSQFVDDLRQCIRASRRDGVPISRVVFDDIDAIPVVLPRLASDDMVWPTVLYLLGTEAITAVCAASVPECDPALLEAVRAACDYTIELGGSPSGHGRLSRVAIGESRRSGAWENSGRLRAR